MQKSAKATIIDSFKKLLTKKSLDKITVKEVCEHCSVNRQTFYNHFDGILDIFKVIFKEELTQDIANNRTFETWTGGFMATMSYLKRNSKMILHVYNSRYWPEVNVYIGELSKGLLRHVVDECEDELGVKLKDKDYQFIINFYKHVFNGLMIDWVSDGMEENPEVLLEKLLIMITGSIPRSVTEFVNRANGK